MLLKDVDFGSRTYLYLERYVNAGSPSGLSEVYITSPHTAPKGTSETFGLSAAVFPESATIEDLGEEPAFFRDWQMLVHPDMVGDPFFAPCPRMDHDVLAVSPTSSSRTVKVARDDGWFIKLSYDGLIGRVRRRIGLKEARSAIHVSKAISRAIEGGALPAHFFYFREVFARVVRQKIGDSTQEWGVVLREPTPFPGPAEGALLVPGFSLFSRDQGQPGHPSILVQLIENQPKPVEDFLFEDVVAPLMDAYFALLLKTGLQIESHAQNTLFVVDRELRVRGVVARDAESIEKDISLMEDLGLQHDFEPRGDKCIRRDQDDYPMRHSLMFDFKLGEYMITPIIAEAVRVFRFDEGRLLERIKAHTHAYLRHLPKDYFPADGKWYWSEHALADRTLQAPTPPRYR